VGTWWAAVAIVVVLIGLPLCAWALTRNARPPRERSSAPPGFARVDGWLAEHYRLSAVERWKVEGTIFADATKLEDPRLREAARGLAAEFLAGRIRPIWLVRQPSWLLSGLGLAYGVVGLLGLFIGHGRNSLVTTFYVVLGVVAILAGAWVTFFLAPRLVRRNLVRLRDSDAGSPAPTQ